MAIDLDDFLDRGGFEKWTGYALFYADYDAIAGSYLGRVSWVIFFWGGVVFFCGGGDYSDSGGAELDCLEGVFDLEETAFGREGTKRRLALRLEVDGWLDGWRWITNLIPRSGSS